MGGHTFGGTPTGVCYGTAGQTNGPQNPLFKPLPTTNFGAQRQRRCSAESYTSTASSDTERDIIVNQVRIARIEYYLEMNIVTKSSIFGRIKEDSYIINVQIPKKYYFIQRIFYLT